CGSAPEGAERLRTLVRNDQKTVISQYLFSNFVSTDAGELKYDQIESEILRQVQGKAAQLYGIQVENIGMERLALPQRITESVFEAMKKERQAMVAIFTSQGEAQATTIKSSAEGIALTIDSFAKAKAIEIENEGLKQANQFYATCHEDEGLATFLLKVDSLP